ncbi:MAG TPA: lipopolysaccharide transport periplasmic protein LptA [Candidatus Macondimonas sp.]|nr:lipopolysaccharide transport periplasmic protein LptA [Candidatus Macondimonas sp.]
MASPLAAAPPVDLPIQIEADRAELDQAQRQSIFIGNVRITQGAAVFTGERVTLSHMARGVPQHIEITGSPAHFSQPADAGNPAIEAKARTMRYQSESGQLELSGEAWIRQGSDEVSGNRLVYDRRNQRILATSEEGGADRVRITIQPRSGSGPATP